MFAPDVEAAYPAALDAVEVEARPALPSMPSGLLPLLTIARDNSFRVSEALAYITAAELCQLLGQGGNVLRFRR